VPHAIPAPFFPVFVLVGAYSLNNSVFDLDVTVAFGLLGLPGPPARLRAGAAGAGDDPRPPAPSLAAAPAYTRGATC
jgi:hypothetical protein